MPDLYNILAYCDNGNGAIISKHKKIPRDLYLEYYMVCRELLSISKLDDIGKIETCLQELIKAYPLIVEEPDYQWLNQPNRASILKEYIESCTYQSASIKQ